MPVPEPNTDSDDYYDQPYFAQNSILTRTSREMESAMNATLDKSLCTDFVDFGKHQDRFGRFSWSKNEKNYLEVKFKVFKKDIANEFKRYQCVSLGQYDFKQFLRLRNQLIVAADNFTKEENLPYINVVGLSRDIDEQLKHVHKVIEIAEGTKRKMCVTLLRYKEDNPETSYAQIRLFTRRTEEENFQQLVYVNYKIDEFIYLLDVMNSVCDQVLDNKPLCNIV